MFIIPFFELILQVGTHTTGTAVLRDKGIEINKLNGDDNYLLKL